MFSVNLSSSAFLYIYIVNLLPLFPLTPKNKVVVETREDFEHVLVVLAIVVVGHVEHLLCGLAVDAAELWPRLRIDRRFIGSRSLGFAPSVALEEM